MTKRRCPFLLVGLWLGLSLFVSSPARAERMGRGIFYPGPWWSFFRPQMIGAFQAGRSNTYSGELSWNPWLAVTPWFAFRGNFGLTYLKAADGGKFWASEYQLFFSFAEIGPLTLEVGAGAQSWWAHGGTQLLASGNLLFPVDEDKLPWFRYLFIGYSAFFLPNLYTHQAKIGIEVTLW